MILLGMLKKVRRYSYAQEEHGKQHWDHFDKEKNHLAASIRWHHHDE
jgi:hypothetical protein